MSAAAGAHAASSGDSAESVPPPASRRRRRNVIVQPGLGDSRWWTQPATLLQCLQFLARLEADRFPRRDGDLGSRARVTADAGFPRAYVKDTEPAKFDPFATAESALHALEDRLHCHFGLGFRNPSPVDHFVN